MIDLHCHILPGLDDGPADIQASLELARIYVQGGFRCVVATPHAVIGEMPEGYARTVSAAAERLNRVLRQNSIGLSVLSGMEVTLDHRLPELIGNETVLTLAGKNHLLVETPFGRLPLGWRNLVFALGARGIAVLFAHPERCAQIMAKPDMLDAMVAAGARLQVNWGSFTGTFGPGAKRLALLMADKGLIHCLATDSHDAQKRHPGSVCEIEAGLQERIGAADLARISRENPLRLLRGMPLQDMECPAPAARPEKQRRWLRWF